MKPLRGQLNITILALVIAALTMSAGMNQESSDGRSGHNGSPGEQTCAKSNCHNTFSLNSGEGEVVISSNDLLNWSYQPGQTYQISLTVSQTGIPLFGFGFEALDEQGNNAGTLVPGSDNHELFALVSGVNRKTITHLENSGLSNNSKTWSFTWTAPETPVIVTFYAVGNAANNNGGRTGDYIYSTSQIVMPEVTNIISPVISAAGPLIICEGGSTELSVVPQAGVIHQWFNNGVNISQGDFYLATQPGCYTVEAQSMSDTLASENEICIEVINLSNEVVLESGALIASQNADSYQWINCDQGNADITGANQLSYIPPSSGNYAVEITLNGCTVVSDCIPFLTISTKDINPSTRNIRFNPQTKELAILGQGTYIFEIFDLSGKSLITGQARLQTFIDTKNWQEGIYFVHLKGSDKATATKILIH